MFTWAFLWYCAKMNVRVSGAFVLVLLDLFALWIVSNTFINIFGGA